MSDIIEIKQAEMLQAINRAEVDTQIATAKQYPRDIYGALNNIKTIATLDNSTAEDCFYALRRQGTLIEGVSVRLAEIIAGAWGNMRVQTRIIGNDGKTITAASAIAFRNAVLKVVPKAVTKRVIDEIKQVALGKAIDLETRRQNMIAYFGKLGVSQTDILTYCGVKRIEEITSAMVFELSGLKNAIKEGTTTVAETFKQNTADAEKLAEDARKQAEAKRRKVAEAAAAATAATQGGGQPSETSEAVNPETGEVTKK